MRVLWLCTTNHCIGRDIPAEYLVHWPGRRALHRCAPCAQQVLRLAEAMGFDLDVEPIPGVVGRESPAEDDDTSTEPPPKKAS